MLQLASAFQLSLGTRMCFQHDDTIIGHLRQPGHRAKQLLQVPAPLVRLPRAALRLNCNSC